MKNKFLILSAIILFIIFGFIACNESETTDSPEKTVLKSGSSEEKLIGSFKDGKYQITDVNYVKELFENQLKRDGITTPLSSFEIKSDVIEGTTTNYLYLIGVSTNGEVRIATVVTQRTNSVYANVSLTLSKFTFDKSCTCSGSCTKGCDPKRWQDSEGEINWKCSSCLQSGKTCNKSVTDS